MRSLWKDADSGVEVVYLTEPGEIAQMVRVFEAVAQEQGWQPGQALGRTAAHALYFALHQEGRPQPLVGGVQLVCPDAAGNLPCHTLWPKVRCLPRQRGAHVVILALEAPYRGRPLLFWSLVAELWRYGVEAGVTTLFLEVTPRVLPLYRRLGWPLQIEGDLRLHWGEECYLCSLSLAEVAGALLHKGEQSPYYREIVAQAFRVTLMPEMRLGYALAA
jgi:hypothetical protein